MGYTFDVSLGGKNLGAALARAVASSRWVGISGGDLPTKVWLRLGRSPEGRLVCTGLVLGIDPGGSEPREVNARALRAVPLGELVGGLAQAVAPKGKTISPGHYGADVDSFGDFLGLVVRGSTSSYSGPVARPGPKGHPREHFERVAEAYRAVLLTHPNAPIKALAEQLHASEATVHRWLQRARDQGFLRESVPGKAGERPARARRPKPSATAKPRRR